MHRRRFLQSGAAGAAGALAWWSQVAQRLARAEEEAPRGAPARSVIVLWLAGGPSQFETFDPHPGTNAAAGSRAIATKASDIQINENYPRLAERMDRVSLVRSVVSKEGDHERATMYLKTGYRPDPTLVHPSLGAVVCHELTDSVEIPRHISILPNIWAARGGYLGDEYDAFKVNEFRGDIADIKPRVDDDRARHRLEMLRNVVEPNFARGRIKQLDEKKTLHLSSIERARRMMTSEQLKAFDINQESQAVRDQFGDSAFGRGCLAAARLIGVGVRCVEVTLAGWDTHAANHEGHRTQAEQLDPAFAALLDYLTERDQLDSTIVLCGGEFGRTPAVNGVGGRDHWPHGFTVALAGGGIAGGRVVGATSGEVREENKSKPEDVDDPHPVADIHATILHSLGIDFQREHITPVGRPMTYSDGHVIRELLAATT